MRKIAIHSVPRSGSSWLGAILDSSEDVVYKFQPLFSYAFKSAISDVSSEEEIALFFEKLFTTKDDFLDQIEKKDRGIVPTFNKTDPRIIVYKEVRYHYILENLLEKDPNTFVIGLIRNPFSVLNSWYNAPREFRKDLGWNFEEEWRFAPQKNLNKREEYNGYEKWKEVAQLFNSLKIKFPSTFYLLRYEDLLLNTQGEVRKMFEFLDLDFGDQTKEFLSNSMQRKDNDPYSVYKVKNAKKENNVKFNLPENVIKKIEYDLKGTELESYLS